jgi:hypothetical protein
MISEHLNEALIEACKPIVPELMERLEVDCSESDACAIATAITKAACEGARLGVVEAVSQLAEQLPGIRLDGLDGLASTPSDLWTERYGGET